jgi:hypothetical protein
MKTIYLSIILALAAILPLQAQYSIESYELATPGCDYYYKSFAEQSTPLEFYSPSDITLKNNLLFYNPGTSDGWLEMPDSVGNIENALKIPVENGLEILLMCVLGYVLSASSAFKKRNPTKKNLEFA